MTPARPAAALSRLACAAVLGCAALPAVAESPEEPSAPVPESWMVRVARMEGASVDVEEAAAALHGVASEIAATGRIHSVSSLSAHARELQRKVTSARLAARVLDQPL
jgi:hypothetical protein